MKPIFRKRSSLLPFSLLLATVILSQGCYSFRVSPAKFDPSTGYQSKTVHSIAWGLAQKRENGIDVVTKNCDANGVNIDEVTISSNLGYSLINVATLGFWYPAKIKWKCAKPCARVGTLP